MMESAQREIVLRDPEILLRRQLGKESTLLSYESSSLVKAGDNYGSTILKVRALVKRKPDAEPEELHLVAKMLPGSDRMRMIFESEYTFRREIFVYEELMPLYRSLYPGSFDVVPELYGARLAISALPGEMDDDAVILMENLKMKGYYMVDRHEGLDLIHAEAALRALAKFHAIGLSIKHKKPSFLPSLQKYGKPLIVHEDSMIPLLQKTLDAVRSDSEMSRHYQQIRATGSPENMSKEYFTVLEPEDPWACLIHSDFWTNNMLFHRDDVTGLVDDAKMLDFQMCYLSSPLADLVFVLCTSMAMPMRHVNEMLQLYRETMMELLGELDCDAGIFEKDNFEKRLRLDAPKELYHILIMAKVVELREGENLEISSVNEQCLARMRRIVEIYANKKWI